MPGSCEKQQIVCRQVNNDDEGDKTRHCGMPSVVS